MKAMMLTGLRKIEGMDVADPPQPGEQEVLLRVGVVGVCGSDVHYYLHGRIGSQVVQYPYRVGHEFSATVVETGRGVSRLRVGDRVAVDPAMPCGQCDQCRVGREHTCRRLRFLGCPGQADGCLSEYIVMPESCCFPIRPGTSLDQAALVEPLSIGVYAVRRCNFINGARIGILGSGPIGLCVMLAARAAGAKAIYVTDKNDARLHVARQAGAAWIGNPDREDIVDAVRTAEPLLLDAVFECCGQQSAMDQAVELLKPGGSLFLVGIPEVDRVSFSIDSLRRKEINIVNIRRQNACVQAALDLIENREMDVNFLVTHRFPLAQSRDAFELVADYRDGVVKAMIQVSHEQ